MIKLIKTLLLTLCIIILVPASISFLTLLFNVILFTSISKMSGGKIEIMIWLLLSPLTGTILGYIYIIRRIQIKMKILFTMLYLIIAYIIALLASCGAAVILIHPPS